MPMPEQARAVTYRFGPWEIDLARSELRANGARVAVGAKAMDVLAVLVAAEGTLVTRAELSQRVWRGSAIDANVVQVHVSALRKAFGPDRSLIKTISGHGYVLSGVWRRDVPAKGDDPWAGMQGGTPGSGNLPQAPTILIGREAALRRIEELLSGCRVLTLVGPGGVGKTRLAVAAGVSLARDYHHGVWFIDLGGLTKPELVAPAMLGAMGLGSGAGASATQAARAIGRSSVLLVLDNCEHVIDAAAVLAEQVQAQCPRAAVIATSREPLRIEGERVYRVPPLSVPSPNTRPEELGQFAATQLFFNLFASHGASTPPADMSQVAIICRRLDGLPLALELAAASVARLGLDATIRYLEDRFRLLVRGHRTAPARHRTLLATLDWSYALLSTSEQRTLRHLSLFGGSFTLECACVVAATLNDSPRKVVADVASLVSKSLAKTEVQAGSPRYVLLETVRAYAAEKLAAAGETEAGRRRHAQRCLTVLTDATELWATQPIQEWLARYGPEIHNVRAALDWAFSESGDPVLGVALAANAMQLLFDLSLVAECHMRADQGIAALRSGVAGDPRHEMHFLTARQATRIYTEGPSTDNVASWNSVLRLATLHDDPEHQARALWGLWNDHIYAGSPVEAIGHARRFVDLAAARNDVTKAVLGGRIMGISLHYRGDQSSARGYLEHSLQQYDRDRHRWQTLGSRLNQATVIRATLARVLWLQGEPETARRLADDALREARDEDHLMSTLYVLVEAAIPLARVTGDDAALGQFTQILVDEGARSGFRIWEHFGRAVFLDQQVRHERDHAAISRFSDAIVSLRRIGFCAHLPVFLGQLARAQAQYGHTATALATIDEAIDWVCKQGAGVQHPELLRIKGDILATCAGDPAQRTALHRAAIAMARKQSALAWELRATTSLADLLKACGQEAEAVAILAPVYSQFREGLETADLIAARAVLSS